MNYCDAFAFREGRVETPDLEKQEEARKKLASLFQEEETERKPLSFDDLFLE